jgi:membrane fusion protein (multidrug efflux system)
MSTPNNTPAATSANPAPESNPKRRQLMLRLGGGIGVLAVAYAIYWGAFSRFHIDTDNAYVQGNVVQITPQVGGTAITLHADDTDYIEAGQPLLTLDPSDAKIALDQAEANLAQTVREIRSTYINNQALTATMASKEAAILQSKHTLVKAEADVQRRQGLLDQGGVTREELQHLQTDLQNARANQTAAQSALNEARAQLSKNQSVTEGVSVANHPRVKAVAAQVRAAYLALKRSVITSPVSGYVAKRGVQLGQRVQAGTPVMSVIPLDQVWVDANFKESQLGQLRIGQPVKLTADVYGHGVEFNGKIAGVGSGTGAAFSLLPAQNATGNWIKVVQRVPVRIALERQEVLAHPLRIGLSMQASVDVHDQSGKLLAEARKAPVGQTQVYAELDQAAEAHAESIIAANLGRQKP